MKMDKALMGFVFALGVVIGFLLAETTNLIWKIGLYGLLVRTAAMFTFADIILEKLKETAFKKEIERLFE